MYQNHNLSKTLATDILSSFINNDNKKIIKSLKKLTIIYEKILHRKKLVYFLKYYYNIIKFSYDDNSNYYRNSSNYKIIIPTNCYVADNNKQYINSHTQIYPDKYSISSFCISTNYISNNTNQNIPKSKNNFISLQKKTLSNKETNKNKQKTNNENPFKKYNSLNTTKIKLKSNSKNKNQTSQQNIISYHSKNHQTTRIITNSYNNHHLIDNQSNKRTLSYGNLGKSIRKIEYKFRPLHYGNYTNINQKYFLNKSVLPPASQSIREFFPKKRYCNCQIIPDLDLLNSNYEEINDLYCSTDQLKKSEIPNNFKKVNAKNLINNINVLLKNEAPIINNNDIYNNNIQHKSAVVSPSCLNKTVDLYYNQTDNELYNNEEDQINKQILAYINNNNKIKQELIDRIYNNSKSKSTKTLYINQNTLSNENNSLYVDDANNIYKNNVVNNDNNNEFQYSSNKRVKTDYYTNNKVQNDNNKKDNKKNNNVIYRNKNFLNKQNKKPVEKILNTFTNNNENIPIGPANVLPQNKKTTTKCNKTKLKIKNFNNNLDANNCLNLTISAKKINNTQTKPNKKQTNIISNEINVEFNLKSEENILKDSELNDTFGMTMQSLNDSKMLEMASKYVEEDNAKLDKNKANEILNEKNAQKLLKKYK